MKSVLCVATGLTAALLALPAQGQSPPSRPDRSDAARGDGRDGDWRRPAAERKVWVFGENGENSFRKLPNGSWLESNQGEHYFTEVARTRKYIDLHNARLGVYARLRDHQVLQRVAGQAYWKPVYDGHWQR
jgi:hypothetical protein